jgi:ribonucleotide reductase alpha subunit
MTADAGGFSMATGGSLAQYQIIRRNGSVVSFEPAKIAVAMMKAFLAVHGTQGAASASVRETVEVLTHAVVRALMRSRPAGGTFHIEDVQDQVELCLMRGGHHEIARAYVLYRERRSLEWAQKTAAHTVAAPTLQVTDKGQRVTLDLARLNGILDAACQDLGADVNPQPIMTETMRNLYDVVPMDEVYQLRIPYGSDAAVTFADESMEAICYFAYWASTELARERGKYTSYKGSLWDLGVLPIDTLDRLSSERGGYVEVDRSSTLDWNAPRQKITKDGMRNSNCVAIAPTATISNIVGVDASIEPCFGNLSVKSNLSGEFTIVNNYLVRDLKRLGLWDDVMVMDLKHFDGSLRPIDRVPEELKALYATAFEVDARWLIEAAARRQKWIDQTQSLNIYMSGASGKTLDETYKLAWVRGLKTTYYLRTMSATHAEKSTVTAGRLNAVSSGNAVGTLQATSALDMAVATARQHMSAVPATDVKFCGIDDPTCESCQ